MEGEGEVAAAANNKIAIQEKRPTAQHRPNKVIPASSKNRWLTIEKFARTFISYRTRSRCSSKPSSTQKSLAIFCKATPSCFLSWYTWGIKQSFVSIDGQRQNNYRALLKLVDWLNKAKWRGIIWLRIHWNRQPPCCENISQNVCTDWKRWTVRISNCIVKQ